MKRFLNRLSVRAKLLTSFILLASFVLILGVTAIIIQQKLKKNQVETLAGVRLSDAFFEGKYFSRSDMHIFTELVKTSSEDRLNYWWGEHEFQIQFFNDQIQKIENEFYIKKSFANDTLENQIMSVITTIRKLYDAQMLPIFTDFHKLKSKEFLLLNDRNRSDENNALSKTAIDEQLYAIQNQYSTLNEQVTKVGLEIITQLDLGKDKIRVLIGTIEADGTHLMSQSYKVFLLFTILGVLFSLIITWYTSLLLTRPVIKILNHVNKLGKGEQPDNLEIHIEDEFGTIQKSLNNLTEMLVKTSEFSSEIGNGNFNSDFKPISEKDILGNSLLHMRDSLKHAREEEEKRRKEDELRSWVTNGLAKFGDIMRQSGDNLKSLSFSIMSNLIDYMEAAQGALFVINDENADDIYFELVSAIAYSRDKYMQKEIRIGEGLVGRVAYEEKTIYLKEIPDNYVKITSGLGTANPRSLLLVPVKLDNKVNGVIELVSFKEFEPYQVEFVEKVGENIASFITSIKINEKTANLLTDSQHKSEELAAQEEEMRQNMEELQATQEEAARREEERNMLWIGLGKLVGIIETDLKGKILDVNEQISRMLGISVNELTDKNYLEQFLSHTGTNAEELWGSVLAGRDITISASYSKGLTAQKLNHHLTLVTDAQGKGIKVLILVQNMVE